MTCDEFQSRLDDAIATRDAAELARLASHGESCADAGCRSAWQDHRLTDRAVAAWRAIEPVAVPSLADRVLAEVAPEEPGAGSVHHVGADNAPYGTGGHSPPYSNLPRRQVSGSQWLSLCVVAALLLAVGFLARPAPDSRHIAIRPQPRSTPDTAAQPQLANATGETRPESYVELAHEATYFMTDLAILMVPADVDEPTAEAGPDWFTRLGERLEPVRTNVEGKLGEWFDPPAT